MSHPPDPNADRLSERFELAWLRGTDALADPIVRAQSLCGEISRVVAADRVSFVVKNGPTSQVVATSTTPAIDPRSSEAGWLRQLADEVYRTGTDVQVERQSIEMPSDLTDATETLAIPVTDRDSIDNIEAAIVLQRYTSKPNSLAASLASTRREIDVAATEVASALRQRAAKSERRATAWWRHAPNWKRLAVVAGIGIGFALLLSIPVPFRLSVEGRLEPAKSFGVFAPAAGTLVEMHASDGDVVAQGAALAELRSVEIDLQQERLVGELAAAETELATLRLRQSDSAAAESTHASSMGHSQDAAQSRSRQMVLRSRIHSLQAQADLMSEVRESLTIRASIDGRIILRDEQSELVGQTISQSQWLMQLADLTAGYAAIIDLPENDDAYLRRVLNTEQANPISDLRLLASPDVQFSCKVGRVADTVQLNERGKAVIEVIIPIDVPLPDDVHVGATVVGTIEVGRRSLGFIWFRPFIEFLRSYGW